MLTLPAQGMNLEDTFACGQTFVWKKRPDGTWAAHIHGCAVRAAREGERLLLHGAREEDAAFWRRYFDLDSDYAAQLSGVMDPHLERALSAFRGMRLLNQPFFETLMSFIISANNNMTRIASIVDRLCALSPEDENGVRAFPSAGEIVAAGRAFVDGVGAGYRAPYLWETACRVARGYDDGALSALPYEQACRSLREFPGVGEKVADCVLLFACGHRSAFPVDTWMEKALRQWYGFTGSRAQLKRQAMARFGEHGGVAQQALFAYAVRTRLKA